MKVQVNKTYVMRNGKIIQIDGITDKGRFTSPDSGHTFNERGQASSSGKGYDLIRQETK